MPTGRLKSLRLFSTLLPISLIIERWHHFERYGLITYSHRALLVCRNTKTTKPR
jgi:hypothetical protein